MCLNRRVLTLIFDLFTTNCIANKKMQPEPADFAPTAAFLRTGRNIRVVFASGLFAPLSENMMSFTKVELYNILHCHQRTTKRRPQVACTEKNDKLKRSFLAMRADKQTDRQTDRQMNKHTNTISYRGRSDNGVAAIVSTKLTFIIRIVEL